MFNLILSALINAGTKLIPDKDKRQELSVRVIEAMLNSKTVPWVDATVKLMYATENFIRGNTRPIASAAIFVWGLLNPEQIIRFHNELGTVGDGLIATIFGALPAWGISRHQQKKRESRKIVSEDEWD